MISRCAAPAPIVYLTCRLLLFAVVLACLANPAHAQLNESDLKYSIDLGEVTRVLNELYPSRLGLPDTTHTFDFQHVQLGEFHYKVPHFLDTDIHKTVRTVEYHDDYVLVVEHPATVSLASIERADAELIEYVPRDFSGAGVHVDFVPFAKRVEEVRRESLENVWRDVSLQSIDAQLRRSTIGRSGITVNIPLPMPRLIESFFGPSEKTHINISGRESIEFAGKSRHLSPYPEYEGRRNQSLFPQLDMKQELDVSLTGTIGDKVFIEVKHNSEAVGDDANRVNVHYEGYEEDVIQRIELGNTSLSLPGQQLVGGFSSGSSKGLFGIKVLAKLGATDITFIASKQEGEASSATFSPTGGGLGREETREIKDTDFVRDKYFYLDRPMAGVFFSAAADTSFRVYRSVDAGNAGTDVLLKGKAFVDPGGKGDDLRNAALAMGDFTTEQDLLSLPGQTYWELLSREDGDYEVYIDAATQAYVGLVVNTPLNNAALAVRYTAVEQNGARHAVGGYYADVTSQSDRGSPGTPTNPLILELIKPKVSPQKPGDTGEDFTWHLMRRNVYDLGMRNIDEATLELSIEDNFDGRLNPSIPVGSFVQWMRIFGLDRYNQQSQRKPDGRVDLRPEVLDPRTGILQFPVANAFAPSPDSVAAWTANQFDFFKPANPDSNFADAYATAEHLYDEDPPEGDPDKFHQYTIVVTAVSAAATFRLDAFNIVEGSEVITVGNTRLTRGTDYTIDYNTGEITLQRDDAISPNAQVRVNYEFKGFGGLTSTSLVGLATNSQLGDNGRLSSTWLYESKSIESDRPRLGDEPTRNFVGGLSTNFKVDTPFLTDLANKLPFVDSDAGSAINFDAEIAASIPNPNTRGEAYVDDFEGTDDSERISVFRDFWYTASPPLDSLVALPSSDRADFIWFNMPGELSPRKRDFNPALSERENETVTVLDLQVNNPDSTSWAGVMTGFKHGGLDISQGQFLEIWVNDFEPDSLMRRGTIHVDFGKIDEDFFQPDLNQFNYEGRPGIEFSQVLDDFGLNRTDDPVDQEWSADHADGRFRRINKTEANRHQDTEDLDDDDYMNQDNSYFSFAVDLHKSADEDIRRQYPESNVFNRGGHEKDAWRKYRIPLRNASIVTDTGSDPDLRRIQHMRIWFENPKEIVGSGMDPSYDLENDDQPIDLNDRIQIGEIRIVGNRWLPDGVRDFDDVMFDSTGTTFEVNVISNKTDASYVPPYRPNVQDEIEEKESALRIRFDELEGQTQLRLRRQFSGRGLNFGQYRDLNMFVNAKNAALNDSLEYYLRLATSAGHYYELIVPLEDKFFPDASGWARIIFKLADLTNLKFSAPDSNGVAHGYADDIAAQGRRYPIRMVGNPSLFRIQYLYAGVRNKRLPGTGPSSGAVFMDDIHLGDVRRDPDYAFRLGTTLNIAGGVLSLSGAWNHTGPDFRGLRARLGSGTTTDALAFSGKTNLNYFIPTLGFSIPVTAKHSYTRGRPKFRPSSDIEIQDAAVRDSLRSEAVTQSIATSIGRKGSKNWLLKYTFGKMNNGISYSVARRRDPALRDTTRTLNGNLGYDISWGRNHNFKLFRGIELGYFPRSLTITNSAFRTKGQSYRNQGGVFVKQPYRYTAGVDSRGSVTYDFTKNIPVNFSMTMKRNLALVNDWHGVNIGQETNRTHSLHLGAWTPGSKWLKIVEPSVDMTTGYNENSDPSVRGPGQKWAANVSSSRTTSMKVGFDPGKQLERLYKKFGWNIEKEKKKRPAAVRPAEQAVRPADSTRVVPTRPTTQPADTTGGRKGFDPFRKLARLLLNVERIRGNITHNTGSNYSRLPTRPTALYQFGIRSASGVEGEKYKAPEKLITSWKMNFNSGIDLTDDIDVQARYTRNIGDTEFRGAASRSVTTIFPDFGLNWNGLEKLGPMSKLFANSRATLDYKRQQTETGIRGKDPDIKRSSFSLSPGVAFSWNNGMNTNVGVSYRKEENDTRGSRTESNSLSINLDLTKQFKGGGGFKLPIPLLSKQFKWKSQLDSKVAMSYSKNGGRRYGVNDDRGTETPGSSTIRVSPSFSYTFTETLNGRAFMDYSRNHSDATGVTTTEVGIGVNVVFTF